MDTITQVVGRGAALLDRECPGWENEIDLTRLDLSSVYDCVLGQIYGVEPARRRYARPGYSYGREELGIGCIQASIDHGFSLGHDPLSYDYRSLTSEWAHLVATRREEANPHLYELAA
jgi:hypothetical protein